MPEEVHEEVRKQLPSDTEQDAEQVLMDGWICSARMG